MTQGFGSDIPRLRHLPMPSDHNQMYRPVLYTLIEIVQFLTIQSPSLQAGTLQPTQNEKIAEQTCSPRITYPSLL